MLSNACETAEFATARETLEFTANLRISRESGILRSPKWAAAYQYAEIYVQWGNVPKALEWLDTAMRLRDPGLEDLKTDPLMDPLRKEPRFQAVMRELKFR